MDYRIVDRFECDAPAYWAAFWDETYNEALYQELRVERQLLALRIDGEGDAQTIFREQRLTPKREVPRPLRRVVGDAISYVETNRFRAADNAIEVITVPGVLADRITTRGRYALEPDGAGVRRVWQGECSCRVPMLGKQIERFIVDEVRRTFAQTTDFTRAWLARG